MAVLLVALSVMAVLATAAMPVWKTLSQREKEAELIFRGEQYVRAIRLFSRRAGPGVMPPNLDVLVQQRFLRKKYKDPITGDDFDLLSPLQANAGSATPGTLPGAAPAGGRGVQPATQGAVAGRPSPAADRGGGQAAGGIMGVVSKSKAESIRLYNGRSHYNEWQFLYVQQTQQPGAPGAGAPGQPGRGGPGRGQNPQGQPNGPGVGRPGGPGQRGFPPPTGPGGRFNAPPGGGMGQPTGPGQPPFGAPPRPPQR
jgi:type II secretory pathway pseudopilin PulG